VHNAYIRKFLQEVNVHGKSDRHMRLLMIETEIRLGTLWDQEECNMTVEGHFLTTGHLSSRHPVVVGAGDVSWVSRQLKRRPPVRRLFVFYWFNIRFRLT
jgi:hypothetical protein